MTEASPVQTLEAVDIVKLLSLLPHRYPFLLVDRIVDIAGDESAIGIKNVTFNEPQFMGHFPNRPVMPGVMIIEAMAQTAGAICMLKSLAGAPPKLFYFMTIDECKFRRPVTPGDQMRLHMTKLKSRRNMWWYRGEAKVDGAVAAEAIVSAMLVENSPA
ncbi:3-hydroxyacyl-ACP dehydratase FabZ [Labrys wisconsinensis]|uniref:3-hydroxyacyl-[acyl-carrier-protein] dehydratase FabZ n=1 Tax=Labrys wisconsinensis TaxID=425677 RepID=A0ABU0J6P5_9HYPH|nr:3-hydroxyacyl-ACP dehydratase FabZ [Labrys wisconsinensis]MDQ0469305.1 3-hydroxyacyl-[acyl-carrier-protein] dehydratase [Labrys wisconsinensis]